jgi:tRNA U34 5-carboxymethylaminomethyl modifying enzyme MnmG/GidA
MHVLKRIAVIVGAFTSDSIEGEYGKESKSIIDGLCLRLDKAIERIRELGNDIGMLKSDKDKIQAKADGLEKENKKLTADITELSDVNSERVQKMISDRADLEAVAGCFKIDCKDKKDSEIRDAIILADDKGVVLDGKSDDYKNARYDMIAKEAKKDQKAFDSSKKSFGEFRKNAQDSKGKGKKDARAEYAKKSAEAWKRLNLPSN